MKKKVLTVVLAMAMATSLLAGCGSSADSTTDTAAATDTADAQDAEPKLRIKGRSIRLQSSNGSKTVRFLV